MSSLRTVRNNIANYYFLIRCISQYGLPLSTSPIQWKQLVCPVGALALSARQILVSYYGAHLG